MKKNIVSLLLVMGGVANKTYATDNVTKLAILTAAGVGMYCGYKTGAELTPRSPVWRQRLLGGVLSGATGLGSVAIIGTATEYKKSKPLVLAAITGGIALLISPLNEDNETLKYPYSCYTFSVLTVLV